MTTTSTNSEGLSTPSHVGIRDRLEQLEAYFVAASSTVVALSGGVDSALLAVVAGRTLGERALAVTGVSPSFPGVQREMVESVIARFALEHVWVDTNEIEDEQYVRNSPSRCYFCKNELYARLANIAFEGGFSMVVDGTNADDLSDHRPGRVAAEERGVRSPLVELGIAKREIRAMARELDVPVWDAPASACLASRIPHGTPVTIGRLDRVERAEAALKSLGFRQLRVRHHEELARIEIALDELPRARDAEMERAISDVVKRAGFERVFVDPAGYRSRE